MIHNCFIPSGKLTVCYRNSPSLIGKSTINVPFSIGILNYQRVTTSWVRCSSKYRMLCWWMNCYSFPTLLVARYYRSESCVLLIIYILVVDFRYSYCVIIPWLSHHQTSVFPMVKPPSPSWLSHSLHDPQWKTIGPLSTFGQWPWWPI